VLVGVPRRRIPHILTRTLGATLNRKYPDHPDGANNPRASKLAKEHGKHIIVASEPTTYKKEQWNLIEKNHAMVVDGDGQFKLDPIALPDNYLAQAITTQAG
jgi:glutamine amidotransferase